MQVITVHENGIALFHPDIAESFERVRFFEQVGAVAIPRYPSIFELRNFPVYKANRLASVRQSSRLGWLVAVVADGRVT
jgi:hypothetical protein